MEATIFERTSTPRHHRGNAIAQLARWYTWSRLARSTFLDLRDALTRGRPVLRTVRSCEPYGRTYHLDADHHDAAVRVAVTAVADALMRFRVGSQIAFLHNLFVPGLTGEQLHRLFALLRGGLVEAAGDDRAALYSPAEATRSVRNDFALHADLFVVERLLLVYDDVPEDDTGGSTFLPRARFLSVLKRTRGLPARVRDAIAALLLGPVRRDSFNRFYAALHGPHAWRDELAAAFNRHQFVIRLRRGEGYLLHDRHWLHGRTRVSQPVGRRRFHRLVYGTPPLRHSAVPGLPPGRDQLVAVRTGTAASGQTRGRR